MKFPNFKYIFLTFLLLYFCQISAWSNSIRLDLSDKNIIEQKMLLQNDIVKLLHNTHTKHQILIKYYDWSQTDEDDLNIKLNAILDDSILIGSDF